MYENRMRIGSDLTRHFLEVLWKGGELGEGEVAAFARGGIDPLSISAGDYFILEIFILYN